MARQICYANLWKLLIDRKISRADFRRAVGISPNTLTKFYREEPVSTEILLRICDYLDCDLSGIVTYERVADEPHKETWEEAHPCE